MNKAAEITENENFRKYLKLRAQALLTDNYFEKRHCMDGHERQ